MVRILGFGEILFDVLGSNALLGGAPLNFCAHAVRAGAQAAMLTSVGKDELGEMAVSGMKKHGISTEYVSYLQDKATGRCLVTLNAAGIPSYNLLEDVAYDYIAAPALQERYDVLYFGTLSLRSAYNKKTLLQLLDAKVADEVFVDMNIRPPFSTNEAILLGLQHATLLKISDEELPAVAAAAMGEGAHTQEAVVEFIRVHYPNVKLLILTCGGDGSVAYDLKTGEVCRCDAVKTQVVSTVGAGDSFCATFIVDYLKGVDTMQALQHASRVSAFVVSREGAVPEDMPQM